MECGAGGVELSAAAVWSVERTGRVESGACVAAWSNKTGTLRLQACLCMWRYIKRIEPQVMLALWERDACWGAVLATTLAL